MSLIKESANRYMAHGPIADVDILAAAEAIYRERLERQGAITNPSDAADFVRARLGHLEHEELHAIWLDTRHHVIGVECLASGTIDSSHVFPREVVKKALRANAAACVLAHNHPSGNSEPSRADSLVTKELVEALRSIEVRLLDHLVTSASGTVSLAERGLM